MKRKLLLLGLILALVAVPLAACAQEAPAPATVTAPAPPPATVTAPAPPPVTVTAPAPAPEKPSVIPLKIGAGGLGGTWFPIMTATMVVINQNVPNVVASVIPGGTLVNTRGINSGELDIALSNVHAVFDAWNGRDPYTEGELRNIRAIGKYLSNAKQMAVRADSDIQSIADLKDKHISVKESGSGTELELRRLFGEYDLTWETIEANGGRVDHLSITEAVISFRDGLLDSVIFDANPPDAHILELETAFPVRVIEIEQAVLDSMKEKYAFGEATIPGGTYAGTPNDTKTYTVSTLVIVRPDLPEDLVYQITKAIYENPETLGKRFAELGAMTPESGSQVEGIPFHSGAARYFKEKGFDVESMP